MFIGKIYYCWNLQMFIYSVKKVKERRQMSTVNDVFRYSLNTDENIARQWSHDLCDQSRIFEHPNNSLQWIIIVFFYIKCFLCNSVKPTRVLKAYVKICPPPSAIVKIFLSLGRCFDKHKRAFSLVEQCRVTSWPCLQISLFTVLNFVSNMFCLHRSGLICADILLRSTAVNVNLPDFGRYNMTG